MSDFKSVIIAIVGIIEYQIFTLNFSQYNLCDMHNYGQAGVSVGYTSQ